MKIAMLGNYAAYFIPRLMHFRQFLAKKKCTLIIIEESDNHRLYSFASADQKKDLERILLFAREEEVSLQKIHKRTRDVLNAINPDVLVTGFISFPFGAAGLRWAKQNNKAIVEYDNQKIETFPRNVFVKRIKKLLLRNVDAFLCPSESWDDTLYYYGFSKEQVFYGLNTTDNSFWAKPIRCSKFDFLPEDFFLTVGRQTKMKNLQFLMAEYNSYLKEGGNISLVMVGDGPEHDIIIKMAEGNPKVVFLPFQDPESLRELYGRMKALLLPSFKYETWGMVVNESMAVGSIVAVSSECGCASTLVKSGVNGFDFNPHKKGEIKKVLNRLKRLSKEEEKQMKEASKIIINDWSVDRFSKGLYDAILYAHQNKKGVKSIFDWILIRLWKGRYNYKDTTS